MNDFVENATHKRIQNLIRPEMLKPMYFLNLIQWNKSNNIFFSTAIVLINAVYFLAEWELQFRANETVKKPFNTSIFNSIQVFWINFVNSLGCFIIVNKFKKWHYNFYKQTNPIKSIQTSISAWIFRSTKCTKQNTFAISKMKQCKCCEWSIKAMIRLWYLYCLWSVTAFLNCCNRWMEIRSLNG